MVLCHRQRYFMASSLRRISFIRISLGIFGIHFKQLPLINNLSKLKVALFIFIKFFE